MFSENNYLNNTEGDNESLIFRNLCNYLTKENDLYTKVLELEKEKTDSIVNRNAEILKKISKNQEEIIKESEKNQSQKDSFLKQFTAEQKLTISNFIENKELDDMERGEIESHFRTLKNIVFQLKDISSKNNILLKNNHDFFMSLISLFEEKDVGYSILPNNSNNQSKNSYKKKSFLLNTEA